MQLVQAGVSQNRVGRPTCIYNLDTPYSINCIIIIMCIITYLRWFIMQLAVLRSFGGCCFWLLFALVSSSYESTTKALYPQGGGRHDPRHSRNAPALGTGREMSDPHSGEEDARPGRVGRAADENKDGGM